MFSTKSLHPVLSVKSVRISTISGQKPTPSQVHFPFPAIAGSSALRFLRSLLFKYHLTASHTKAAGNRSGGVITLSPDTVEVYPIDFLNREGGTGWTTLNTREKWNASLNPSTAATDFTEAPSSGSNCAAMLTVPTSPPSR